MSESKIKKWFKSLQLKVWGSKEAELEQELVRMTRPDVAQRLIEMEEERKPGASRRSHIESAIWRLKKDRK